MVLPFQLSSHLSLSLSQKRQQRSPFVIFFPALPSAEMHPTVATTLPNRVSHICLLTEQAENRKPNTLVSLLLFAISRCQHRTVCMPTSPTLLLSFGLTVPSQCLQLVSLLLTRSQSKHHKQLQESQYTRILSHSLVKSKKSKTHTY